jgi:uncharacterized OsmC-like protein
MGEEAGIQEYTLYRSEYRNEQIIKRVKASERYCIVHKSLESLILSKPMM